MALYWSDKLLRLSAWLGLCLLVLTGCTWVFGGEAVRGVTMHRPKDGATASCISGTFATGGLFGSGEAKAQRLVNACVLACRQQGFIEDDPALDIDQPSAVLRPDEGWGNTPAACRT
jgi:hypothetical protein